MVAPGVDRILEVADDGKADRRQPRRHPVQQIEGARRKAAQRGAALGRGLVPVAAQVFGGAVQHHPAGADRHQEPEEHAEHMPVHGDDCRFQRVPHDLGNRHLDGVQAGPLVQQRARGMDVVAVQGLVDVGEEVAELAKAQRHVQHQHIPGERQRHADRGQQVVHHDHRQGQRHDHGQPGQRGIARPAGVEGVFRAVAECAHDLVDRVVAAQGAELFSDQRQENGNKGHLGTGCSKGTPGPSGLAGDVPAQAQCIARR
ncbi:hypothetical protein D9M72_268350 [compost metagenome]